MTILHALGRYRLLDIVTEAHGHDGQPDQALWHGHDDVLDRPIAVRIVPADDPRAARVVGAAQAAAGVDDRRLLRVLDILDLPAAADQPARIAVVSEWGTGRSLDQALHDRAGAPFEAAEALALVTEVARAVAASGSLGHGRLRPSSVVITDAGEVRVRGLAVDAALFGGLPDLPDRGTADVDALGSLLYLLTTGTWPGAANVDAPPAPRVGGSSPQESTGSSSGTVLPPSQVRAGVPRSIDSAVARSVLAADRPRGVARVTDPAAFAAMTGAAHDHAAPTPSSTRRRPLSRRRRIVRSVLLWAGRAAAVIAAVALVAAIAWTGWTLLTTTSDTGGQDPAGIDEMLTSPARPVDDLSNSTIEQTYPIIAFRSYDPFGDDDGNGKPDKRRGLENEEQAITVNDDDPDTSWVTAEYGTPDLDGKEGVGLILDLGQPQDVQQVSLNLVGAGSNIDVRVADKVLPDPALWTPLASAFATRDRIDIRSPRPVTGRYVLVWFTQVPPAADTASGVFQGGIRSAVVSG